MRQKRNKKFLKAGCSHTALCLSPTRHAAEVGYQRPTFQQRAAATTTDGREPRTINLEELDPATFPAPLIIPGDDLSSDPRYPPQSVRAWIRGKERNKITPERRTIYVAGPPDVDSEVDFICAWSEPVIGIEDCHAPIAPPKVQDIVQYLSSFYYGLPVKSLTTAKLRYHRWDDAGNLSPNEASRERAKSKHNIGTRTEEPQYIGLATSTEIIRIRTRPSHSQAFRQQINLDDLLDATINVLPEDAYALLLLVKHDLFEDEEDEFVCGRAYGGSRVAVVSSARYHPSLDHEQRVEREHAWPASHCKEYLNLCCANAEESRNISVPLREAREKKDTRLDVRIEDKHSFNEIGPSPLQAAVLAHSACPSFDSSSALEGLWLGRVCKTASHELGHCFGIDHCIY